MTIHEARMSKEGRVLIPAVVRQELGLSENEPLSIYVQDGEVRIVSRLQAIRRMQQRMAKRKKPGESVVDELLRERRQEAKRGSK
jgi:AbrB family looped-hinge helix DNA binding protein